MAPELSKSASDSRGVPRHFIIAVFDMEKMVYLRNFLIVNSNTCTKMTAQSQRKIQDQTHLYLGAEGD